LTAPAQSGSSPLQFVAATTCVANLPLDTRNPDDFAAFDDLVEIIALP